MSGLMKKTDSSSTSNISEGVGRGRISVKTEDGKMHTRTIGFQSGSFRLDSVKDRMRHTFSDIEALKGKPALDRAKIRRDNIKDKLQFVSAVDISNLIGIKLDTIRKQLTNLKPLALSEGRGNKLIYPVEQFICEDSSKLQIAPEFNTAIHSMREARFNDLEIMEWLVSPTTYQVDTPLPVAVEKAQKTGDYQAMLLGLKGRTSPETRTSIPIELVAQGDIKTFYTLLNGFNTTVVQEEKNKRVDSLARELIGLGVTEFKYING